MTTDYVRLDPNLAKIRMLEKQIALLKRKQKCLHTKTGLQLSLDGKDVPICLECGASVKTRR